MTLPPTGQFASGYPIDAPHCPTRERIPHDKILRVVRTIANFDACADIQLVHLQEAINYGMLDRTLLQ